MGGPSRIVPTPKPRRSKLIPGILVGLLVGLLLFAPAGYLVRFVTAHPKASPTPTPTAAPVNSPGALSAFERNQVTLNQAKFAGDLAPFARSWLPYVSGCAANSEPNGPKLGDGEVTRVTCHVGGVTTYFVQFAGTAERDRSIARRNKMNADGKQLLSGTADPRQQKSTSGNASGNYIEYGFKSDNTRTYAAIWWDNTDTLVGGFLVADWHSGLNDSWEPLRDLWQRFA
jgi:hypothetical protein